MADIAASAITILDGWTEGGVNGKHTKVLRVKLLPGAGNWGIPASVFGWSKFYHTAIANFHLVSDDSHVKCNMWAPTLDQTVLKNADLAISVTVSGEAETVAGAVTTSFTDPEILATEYVIVELRGY